MPRIGAISVALSDIQGGGGPTPSLGTASVTTTIIDDDYPEVTVNFGAASYTARPIWAE